MELPIIKSYCFVLFEMRLVGLAHNSKFITSVTGSLVRYWLETNNSSQPDQLDNKPQLMFIIYRCHKNGSSISQHSLKLNLNGNLLFSNFWFEGMWKPPRMSIELNCEIMISFIRIDIFDIQLYWVHVRINNIPYS